MDITIYSWSTNGASARGSGPSLWTLAGWRRPYLDDLYLAEAGNSGDGQFYDPCCDSRQRFMTGLIVVVLWGQVNAADEVCGPREPRRYRWPGISMF